ncbi:MAG: FHA domain-containing protein [Moorea sp. SIO3C2]|nr:FHA domain-containing protein [Moorena sp. SIO3C2]
MASEAQQNHLLILEDDKGRREFGLDSPVYTIGREPKCDIRLISQFVSRRHATLVQIADDEGQGYYYRIVDGNLKGKASVNGLIINGRKLPARDLEDGDTIIFGPGVKATYYMLNRAAISTTTPDEFDITLIGPNMMPDGESDAIPDGAKIAFAAGNGQVPENDASSSSDHEE